MITLEGRTAWYVGKQRWDNGVEDEVRDPYLCALPAGVASRCRYAASMALLTWRDREFTVAYFVDPVTRRLFAKPYGAVRDDPAASESRDGTSARRSFTEAREFAHSIAAQLTKPKRKGLDRKEWWKTYVAWGLPDLPPPPLDVPADPEMVYLAGGWNGYLDWTEPPSNRAGGQAPGGDTQDS